MEAQQLKIIESILSDLSLSESTAISAISSTKTKLDELTHLDGNLLIKHLKERQQIAIRPMRGKIIHLLCVLGMIKEDGSMDYHRQDAYIKGIGSRNPKRKALAWLNFKETLSILNQVEAMVRKDLNK